MGWPKGIFQKRGKTIRGKICTREAKPGLYVGHDGRKIIARGTYLSNPVPAVVFRYLDDPNKKEIAMWLPNFFENVHPDARKPLGSEERTYIPRFQLVRELSREDFAKV